MSSRAEQLEPMRAAMPLLMQGTGPLPGPIPVELIKANHLGPLAYRLGAAELRDEYAAATIMHLRRRALLDQVLQALAQKKLSVALLKGVAYVGTIYERPEERPMNDMDLLVRPTELPEVMRAMLALGFERNGMSRKLSGYYHAIPLERDRLLIELHRNIIQPHRANIRPGDMWRRAKPDKHLPAMRLDPVDELLLCMVHIARHELAVPAINYVDVWRSRARLTPEQRETLFARAHDMRVSRAVTAVLSMTDKLANAERGHAELGAASRFLPTTDDVLLAVRPKRLRQISQKLSLLEGPRELAGLGFVYVKTYVDGRRRDR